MIACQICFGIAFVVALIAVIAWFCCKTNGITPCGNKMNNSNTEKFISSGSEGSFYDENNDVIVGSANYTNQIIQNNKSWCDVVDGVKNNNIASDGSEYLGAGPGDGFDEAMKSQIEIQNKLDNGEDCFYSNKTISEIDKTINNTTSSTSNTSLFNRGNNSCAKMIILPNNSQIGIMEEKYYPERDKNRNIYKANTIVPIQGFDIPEDRIGGEFANYHVAKFLSNTHKRTPTAGGSTFVGANTQAIDESIQKNGNEVNIITDKNNGISSEISDSYDSIPKGSKVIRSQNNDGFFVKTAWKNP